MTADEIFSMYPEFVQEYIYKNGWNQLREVQIQAAEVLLGTNSNLLLSSSTASGKTEAALFPVLSDYYQNPPMETGAFLLYIAPLKSLINDQFERLDTLLDLSGIEVTDWHGDVSQSRKTNFIKKPSGILQITPESLESFLIRRSNDIPRLFGALKYVIVDEIHTLIGTDRGNQIICQICRIEHLIGHSVRRIGLSATIGDLEIAKKWLAGGSKLDTIAPVPTENKLTWRLGLEHFYAQEENPNQSNIEKGFDVQKSSFDPGFEFLYKSVKGKKAIVFSNSREETEYVTATLRQIAKNKGDRDTFYIHHGNLSASLREDAEGKMKDESVLEAVTCATVTLELGIDIGKLERVTQVGAPTTVSGFLQRLGRSGRRGTPPEMVMVFREENPLPYTPLPQLIPFDLLRAIAIVELYAKERFIEPPQQRQLPFSLLYHQTLSVLASHGELTPKQLSEIVLSFPPFENVTTEDYKSLLKAMLQTDDLEPTERRGVIIGLRGEKIINNFKFFAVFKDSEDYAVRCQSDEIGTITNPPPVGDRFALAGRVWEVTELDLPRKMVYVKKVEGKMEISWPGDGGVIHTRILEKMKDILFSNEEFSYLLPNAKTRLSTARNIVSHTKMKDDLFVSLGGSSWVLFPWLGTLNFRTCRRVLKKYSEELGIYDIESSGCNYITFKGKDLTSSLLTNKIKQIIHRDGLDRESLVSTAEYPIFDKFDEYIPAELIRKSYAYDKLSTVDFLKRFEVE